MRCLDKTVPILFLTMELTEVNNSCIVFKFREFELVLAPLDGRDVDILSVNEFDLGNELIPNSENLLVNSPDIACFL